MVLVIGWSVFPCGHLSSKKADVGPFTWQSRGSKRVRAEAAKLLSAQTLNSQNVTSAAFRGQCKSQGQHRLKGKSPYEGVQTQMGETVAIFCNFSQGLNKITFTKCLEQSLDIVRIIKILNE